MLDFLKCTLRMLGFFKCKKCADKGEYIGFGGMTKECEECKCKRKITNWFKLSKIHLSRYGLIYFLIMLFIGSGLYCGYLKNSFFAAFAVVSFSSIFVVLKYNLDKANYKKDMAETGLI